MKVVKLNNELVPAFRKFFAEHSKLHDESFPPAEDYSVSDSEPAYLLLDEAGNIAGAAALMMTPEYIEAGSARFRMFYCKEQKSEHYKNLLNEILNYTAGLNSIYCYTDDKQNGLCAAWEETGFKAKHFAWILERDNKEFTDPQFPTDFELKTFRRGIDEENWCSVINDAFRSSLGHVRMTPERINEWRKEPSWLEDGLNILWRNGKAVGSIGISNDTDDGENAVFIDAVGVIHELHGKGLGKNLLRYGLKYAVMNGYSKAKLSVNGENDKAAELYFKEGFVKEALYKCYYYDIKK